MKCVSCIKDGKTGECYDIKDKEARSSIEEITGKVNEVVETVNAISGADGGHFATDEDIQNLQTQIDEVKENAGGSGVSQEDFDSLVNNTTVIANSSGNFRAGTSAKGDGIAIGKSANAPLNSVAIGENTYVFNAGGTAIGKGAQAFTNGSIQLGEGRNMTGNSLQLFDDNIYNADTHTLTVQNIELNGEDLATKIANAGGGGSVELNLYRHDVIISKSDQSSLHVSILNSNSVVFDFTTFIEVLGTNNKRSNSCLSATGIYVLDSVHNIIGTYAETTTASGVYAIYNNGDVASGTGLGFFSTSDSSITDTVSQIV